MHIIHDCMICLMLNHFITISHFNVFLFKHIAFSYPNDTEEQKGGTVSVLYRHRHFSTHKSSDSAYYLLFLLKRQTMHL